DGITDLQLNVTGSIEGENIGAIQGNVDLNATGDVNLYQIRAVDSTVKIEAGKGATDISDGGSLRFDNAIIRKSDMALAANDTIGMHQREGGGTDCSEYGQRVFIRVDEDDTDAVSSLTLTANRQIGEEDNHLVVDIPEAVTLKIPVVGDLFADSLELEPKVTRSGEEKDVRITKDDLAYDLIKPVGHPDNPMVNEFMGTEVETGKNVDGDYLAHITDKIQSAELPFQTNEEIAGRIVDQKGSDWAEPLDKTTVLGLMEDPVSSETINAAVSENTISKVLEDLRTTEKPVSETDRELVSWIVDNNPGYEELAKRLADGDTLTDDEVAAVLTNYSPDSTKEESWKNAQIAAILKTTDELSQPIGADALWTALKESNSEDEKLAILTALLDLQTADGSTVKPVTDLSGLLNSLLTEEEMAQLMEQAIAASEIPAEAAGGYTDPEPKPIHVAIGESTGRTNLYNDGDIDITVTGPSDLTAELIRSERGDVSVDVQDGSILTTGDGKENILGADVNLKASEDIGTDTDAVDLQQRDNTPTVVVNVESETPTGEKTGTVHLDENGNWVMDTAVSYDWIRKDIDDAAMRLDAEATNGDINLNEVEGDTGLGQISAEKGDVTITTDGDVSDARTEAEKTSGDENITSGGDTEVNAENGSVGTREEPIDVNVGGHMTVNDQGDIHVVSTEDLSITADTQEGVVNVHSDQDLYLDNTAAAAGGTGNMIIQEATAGGDATVNVTGDITGRTETDTDGNETTTESAVSANGNADVTAGGDVSDTTVTAGKDAGVTAGGDVNTTNVTAGDTASVTADGEIRTDNGALFSGDSVELLADADNDGKGSVGTAENPVHVDTASGNSGTGSLSASGTEVYVEEETGDLALKEVTAAVGDAEITSPGNVTDAKPGSPVQNAADAQQAASDAQNLADAAADKADVLDKHATRLEEEAQKARDEADAAIAEAAQAAADAAAKNADATIAEAAAVLAKQEAQNVQDDIDLIDHQIELIQNNTGLTDEEKATQIEAQKALKEPLLETLAEKEQAAKEAQEKAEALRKEADEAAAEASDLNDIATAKDAEANAKKADATNARSDANTAAADAAAAKTAADAAKATADVAVTAADSADQTVETKGDLIIHAGGSVGSDTEPLETSVGGDLSIGAPGNIAIANQGDLNVKDLNADGNAAADRDISLTAGGELSADTVITGEKAEINTLHGNAGSESKPLELDVDRLSGTVTGDADLINHGDLTVDDLTVSGELDLTAEGSLKGGDAAPGTANITADTARLHADGDVGETGDPLETAINAISVSGDDVEFHSIKDTTIDKITGDDIHVAVDGEIYTGTSDLKVVPGYPTANIVGDNLTLDTTGGISEEDDPLYVYIPGELNVNNQTDDPYVINLYGKGTPTPPGPGPSPGPGYDGSEKNVNQFNKTWLIAWAQYLRRHETGGLVFRADWSAAPYQTAELRRSETDADTLTLSFDGWSMTLKDVAGTDCAEGRICGIFATNDDGTDLAKDHRYLLLTAEFRRILQKMGFRWIVFRVDDIALLIDLNALERSGEYIFGLDPSGKIMDALMVLWYEEEAVLRLENGAFTGPGADHYGDAVFFSEVSDDSPFESAGAVYHTFAEFVSGETAEFAA
ncbi:MAG: hypothetical protein IKO00_13900, partial [Oscillospiraceae bacterium]|nr:hypothetical protein [Oscillospiraceae bacterium]